MIIGGLFMGLLAKHKKNTTYTATRSVVIAHNLDEATRDVHSDGTNNALVSADTNMMPTYSDIAENESITDRAYKLLPVKVRKSYTKNEINEAIKAKTHPQSLVLNIEAETKSKNDSIEIVNATAQAFKNELPKLQPGAGKVTLLEKANSKNIDSSTTPHLKKYVIVGALLGAMIGIIISFAVITFKDFEKKAKK